MDAGYITVCVDQASKRLKNATPSSIDILIDLHWMSAEDGWVRVKHLWVLVLLRLLLVIILRENLVTTVLLDGGNVLFICFKHSDNQTKRTEELHKFYPTSLRSVCAEVVTTIILLYAYQFTGDALRLLKPDDTNTEFYIVCGFYYLLDQLVLQYVGYGAGCWFAIFPVRIMMSFALVSN